LLGGLSQLNPLGAAIVKAADSAVFLRQSVTRFKVYFNWDSRAIREGLRCRDANCWVRLHEKRGKRHEMPCHHNLEAYLRAYIDETGIIDDPKGPLFRAIGRGTHELTRTRLPPANAYMMIKRRAAGGGIETKIGNHSFRATGITAYLKNGGTLEKASSMANHASTRTTQLYDRRSDEITLDEVERVGI
jgi:integrase